MSPLQELETLLHEFSTTASRQASEFQEKALTELLGGVAWMQKLQQEHLSVRHQAGSK